MPKAVMPNATAASGSRTSMAAVELLVRPGRKAALQPGAEGLGRLLGRISGLSPLRHDVGAPQRRRDGERHEHEHADDDESEIDIACTAEQQPRRDHEPDQQPRRGLMDRRMELIRHPVGRSGRPVHGGLGHRASLGVEIYLLRMSCCPTAQLPSRAGTTSTRSRRIWSQEHHPCGDRSQRLRSLPRRRSQRGSSGAKTPAARTP